MRQREIKRKKKKGETNIIGLDDKNIAWESEKARYKNIKTINTTEVDWKTIQWQDMEDGKLLLFIYFYGFLFNLLFLNLYDYSFQNETKFD